MFRLLGINPSRSQYLRRRLLGLSEVVGNSLRVSAGIVCFRQPTCSTQCLSQQKIAHVAGFQLHGVRNPSHREREIALPLRE